MINTEALATVVNVHTSAISELMAKTNAIYLTLMETEHGPKMAEYYQMFKAQLAQAEGDSMISSVLDKPADE